MDEDQSSAQTVPVNFDPQNAPAEELEQPQPMADNDAVEEIKQQAVASLLPVIDAIEGTPEHKFEVIMNALQSVSSPELLQKALDAANQIEDPSRKAEALVDVLNETKFSEEIV